MNVTLCSAFRNASGYIERYANQVDSLSRRMYSERGDHLHAIWCEGDSTDDTYAILALDKYEEIEGYLHFSLDLFQHAHGGPDYGSVVNADRFANLAKVWGAIWQRIPANADAVLFVESDLIWEPATILALLDDLAGCPAVAPMVMLHREGWHPDFFYDNWAFRRGGKHISPMPPYFGALPSISHVQLDSAGSCMAIRGDLARQLTWPAEDVIVGVCRQIYERGGSVWLDPKVSVIHE